MARKKIDDEPSLFDDLDDPIQIEPSLGSATRKDAESTSNDVDVYAANDGSTWVEVDQATFLSWPRKKQFAYCAARDYAGSLDAEDEDEVAFLCEREMMYRRELNNGTA